jgi:hypothetical protein
VVARNASKALDIARPSTTTHPGDNARRLGWTASDAGARSCCRFCVASKASALKVPIGLLSRSLRCRRHLFDDLTLPCPLALARIRPSRARERLEEIVVPPEWARAAEWI